MVKREPNYKGSNAGHGGTYQLVCNYNHYEYDRLLSPLESC